MARQYGAGISKEHPIVGVNFIPKPKALIDKNGLTVNSNEFVLTDYNELMTAGYANAFNRTFKKITND